MGVEVGRVSTTARRRIAATAAVLLVVGLAPFVAALVAPQPALAVPGEDPVAPDAASARVAARASGHRVEVGKARRETSQTFVNSDGSFTLEEYAGPVRARRADGSWGAIDTTLRRNPDGSVSPTLDTVSLSFSGGGRAALASVGAQGTQLSLVWPGTLPAPVLHAETATYPDVLPGVDLLVRAEVGGFSELLVVKTREAAANPALTAVSFTTVTRGLTLKPGQGGSVSAVDAHGNAVFGSGTAMMWDSGSRGSDPVTRTSGERAAADPRGAAAGGRRAAMAVEVGPGRLTVKPDRALLTAPDATLPIYLDPSYYTATNPQWTMINGRYTNQSYWSYDRASHAKVGFEDADTPQTYRSLFQFSTAGWQYKHILGAVFSADLLHSWICSDTRTDLHLTPYINSGTTWNNNAGGWSGVLASSWSSSCNDVRKRVEWGSGSLTNTAQTASNAWGTITLGLKSDNETNHNGWKKFDESSPKLAITYNSYPNVPDQQTTEYKGCATGGSRPYIGSGTNPATPTLRTHVSDPDGGLLFADFAGARMNIDGSWGATGGWGNQPNVASNSSAQLTVPASVNLTDGTYRWQARVGDGTDWGQWSGWCEFTVDTVAPGAPTGVTSSAYPADGAYHGGVGIAGTFTFTPPATNQTDVFEYVYALGSGSGPSAGQSVTASTTDHTASAPVTPLADGPNTLRVWTRDRAGNISDVMHPYEYVFRVKIGSAPAARWTMDEASGPALDATPHGNTAALTGGVSRGAGRAGVGSTLTFDGSTGYAATTGAVNTIDAVTSAPKTVRTDANFTVTAWVYLTANNRWLTAAAEEGSRSSAFYLQFNPVDNRWCFSRTWADTDNTGATRALSAGAPALNTWTHLAGVYDASTSQLRLYVNGVLESAVSYTSAWNATGPVTIGRAKWNGAMVDFWAGSVDEVQIYDRVLAPGEIQAMAVPLPPVLTFPYGTTPEAGQQVTMTVDARGDTNVTSFKYSVGDASLSLSATPAAAGGSATVTFTPSQPGDLNVFAVTVAAGRQSTIAVATLRVLPPPSLAGTVTYQDTGLPAAGVTVTLAPLGSSTTTGADGTYRLTGMAAGDYTVASSDGTSCGMFAVTQVTITGPTFVDLELAPTIDGCGYAQSTVAKPFVPAGNVMTNLTGDDEYRQIGLPFVTTFYGARYNSVWVSTNGYVSFVDPQDSYYANDALPSAALPNASLYPFWDDLYVDAQSSMRTAVVGTAPDRQFVIEWRDVTRYDNMSARLSAEVLIGEDGTFTFDYASLDAADEQGSSATVGIEDPNGLRALQYEYQQPILVAGTAVVYTPTLPYTPPAPGYLATTEARAFTPADATVLSLTGDDALTTITTPFPLLLYGQSYTQALLSTNGFLTFGADPGAAYTSSPLPAAALPNAAVYPFWDDLWLDTQSSVRTAVLGSAPTRQFVIEWRNVGFYTATEKRITFEIVFSESGQIVFNYASLDDPQEQGLEATVGVENADGTDAVTWSAFQAVLQSGTAIVLTPNQS